MRVFFAPRSGAGQGFFASFALLTLLFSAPGSFAETTELCGDASGDGEIAASDGLLTLQVAVGSRQGSLQRCDCNASGSVTATDAMTILQCAVGLAVTLECPLAEEPTTTTTTLPPATCGNGELEDGEDCDNPGWFCRGGCNPWTGICVDFLCGDDCSCPPPLCGDAMIDPNEDCDPPGSECEGGTCGDDCACRP